jgi:hypothetical protein
MAILMRHRDNPPPVRHSWEVEEIEYEEPPVHEGDPGQRL